MELMNNMKLVLEDILKGKRRAALGGHVRPDGDCVGSCLGLYMYLKEQYPEIETDVYLENVPEALSNTPPSNVTRVILKSVGLAPMYVIVILTGMVADGAMSVTPG